MRYKMGDWVHAYVRAILAVSVLLEEFAVAEQGTAIAVVLNCRSSPLRRYQIFPAMCKS